MSELSLVLPEIGKADRTEDPKIVTAFTQVQTWANGNIGGVNVEDDLTGLRLVEKVRGFAEGGKLAGTYIPTTATLQKLEAGLLAVFAPTTVGGAPNFTYLNSTDYAISGKETKLTLKVDLATNQTEPGAKLTFGLYPIEQYLGGENELQVKYEVVHTGSTVLFEPLKNQNYSVKTAFSFPTADWYSIGVETSATLAAKSVLAFTASLFVSNT